MIKMLAYDASERITSREALRHQYFREIRELEMRRQQAMHPTMNNSMHAHGQEELASEGSKMQQAPRSHRDDADASSSNKALPTIGSNAANSVANANSNAKNKSAKIIPQAKYTGASAEEADIEGSLPPIMGVMGNSSKMQQTYKYKTMDKGPKARKKKQPKMNFESKHSYS